MSGTNLRTPAAAAAERAMGFEADVRVDLRGERRHPSSHDGSCFHRHVALEWEGGVLWLEVSDQGDHYCVDVRQFVPAAGEVPVDDDESGLHLAGQGVFTIVNGRRQALMSEPGVPNPRTLDRPLHDPDGTPVRGHGWNGGYVVTLMHDRVPSEKQTNRPAGPGRG